MKTYKTFREVWMLVLEAVVLSAARKRKKIKITSAE